MALAILLTFFASIPERFKVWSCPSSSSSSPDALYSKPYRVHLLRRQESDKFKHLVVECDHPEDCLLWIDVTFRASTTSACNNDDRAFVASKVEHLPSKYWIVVSNTVLLE
jgi:hypothetical protein